MVPIQMVDLKRQYTKIKSQVDAAIGEVLENSAFINGGAVQKFAGDLQTYLGSKHVIPCANGTDALQIAMMALGLEPGDEVITPSFTFIATAEVIALLHLKPVFVDVDPQTYCLDVAAIEKAITPKTKAIVPVHLYGHVADMEPLMALAAKHNLYVIEDNAQAIGADYTFKDGSKKKAGAIGHIGCTSFFPSKNLGCYGDGGAIFTNDDELAAKLRMVANHGQSARYYHDVVGCNSRLDSVQAAVLNIKLPLLDEYIAARRAVADAYDAAFAGIPQITTPYRAPYSYHVFHQYTLQLNGADRNELQQYLSTKGVPAMIYYPVPGHRQKMFEDFGGAAYNLPVTDNLTTKVISLPIHTEMDPDQLEHIIQSVKSFLNNPPT
ncbi:DegT/DnrJ/EryC1/StrS family aminotransferase [Chitinophaga sp. 22321]|uniref:DegT/DnrJ/EryC1/StrS family aminotransferase n=1 Tax=Chitinophaga hostae TaxID=2831022 RepID=A0ABS5J9C4_9BACT|nr:DegT/DnrJ/EryC1/StrS family aminotransferase [Chitinophaga hostae]MBS0031701.1 DegT/DnrJ/EryC1/StrS family aminotransferase [Chitinophaga hostae]